MSSNLLTKAWGALLLLLVVVWSFFLGLDIAAQDWRQVTVDSIMLAFWVFLAVFAVVMMVKEAKLDAEIEASRKELSSTLDKLMNKLHDDMLDDLFMAIVKNVCGKTFDEQLPTAEQLNEIKQRFEDETDHKVSMTLVDGKIEVEIDRNHNHDHKDAA